MLYESKEDSAVSPVIGVVLMVAVTVALVALVTVTVFDIGDDVSEPADISVSTDFDEPDEELTIEVIRNENVDKLVATGSGMSSDVTILSTTGEVTTQTLVTTGGGNNLANGGTGTVDVVATVGENEEVVSSVDIDTSGSP